MQELNRTSSKAHKTSQNSCSQFSAGYPTSFRWFTHHQ